jgi:hypothetical protein
MIDPEELAQHVTYPQGHAQVIRTMEAAAVAHLERMTNRYFGPPRDRIEFVQSRDGYTLYLDGPVVPETAVVVDERVYIGGDATAIEEGTSDGFVVRDDRLLRAGGLGWPYEYEVEYRQGYEVGEEPADVRMAVIELVRWLYGRKSVSGVYLSETLGDYSYELKTGDWASSSPFAVGVVNTYKRIPI